MLIIEGCGEEEKEEEQEDPIYPTGRHTYDFEQVLPEHLPASLENPDCHVRYLVRCVIERPWKEDFVYKKAFTVVGDLDLNDVPDNKVVHQPFMGKKLRP